MFWFRNPLFTKAISDEGFMSNPNSCEPGAPGRRLQSTDEFDVENFGEVAGIWIVVSAVLALLGGLLVVYLFRKLPRVMVILGVSIPVRVCLLQCRARHESPCRICGKPQVLATVCLAAPPCLDAAS